MTQENTIIYKYILFDADGTLFNLDKAEEKALENTFVRLGQPYLEKYLQTYRMINHALWDELEKGLTDVTALQTERFRQLLNALSLPGDPAAYNVRYLIELAKGSQLLDGAQEVCRSLSQTHTLVIVTNGIPAVQHPRLEGSPIFRYFSALFISGEIGHQKPQKEFFDIVFEKLGITDTGRVLIVGDSLTSDIQGGNNAGIATCWYNPTKQANKSGLRIDYEISDLKELLTIKL